MKNLTFAALLLCLALVACKQDDESDQFIHPVKTHLNIILGTEGYLNLTYNVSNGFTHLIDNEEIATLRSTEKHDDGRMTLILKGKKLGKTQIHLMEGITNKYEAVVDIECTNLSGDWIESCDDLPAAELVQSQVLVSDPQIKAKIEQEILTEAYGRLSTYYVFSDRDMTFSMTTRDEVTHKGTYEQEDNCITLRYNDTTESFVIVNGSRCHFLWFDYTDKYKALYPNAGVHTVSCQRCFSIPRRP